MWSWLSAAYVRAPRSLDPLLHVGRRYVMPVLRRTLPVARLVGKTACGDTARVLVVDRQFAARRLCRLLFAGGFSVAWTGKVPLVGLRGFLEREREAVDLVIATIPRGLPSFLRPARGLLMPGLVELVLPVAPDRERQYALAHVKRRNRLRRAERSGFAFRLGATAADVRRFINAYHLPHVTEKFGDDAILQEPFILERHARHGGVLWLLRDGRVVGGDLFTRRGDVLWLMVTGTETDLPPSVPSLQEALFLLATDLARQLGRRAVSCGAAAPILREGLMAFKISIGARVADYAESHRELVLDWARPSPALHALLRDHPPIVRHGGGFAALTSTAGVEAAAQLGQVRKLLPPGVTGTVALGAGSDTIDAAMAFLSGPPGLPGGGLASP